MRTLILILYFFGGLSIVGWSISFFKVLILKLNFPGLNSQSVLVPGTFFFEFLFNSEYNDFSSSLQIENSNSDEFSEASPFSGHFHFFAGPYDAPFQITIAAPIWSVILLLTVTTLMMIKLSKGQTG